MILTDIELKNLLRYTTLEYLNANDRNMAIICIHVYIYTVFGEATHTAVVLERKGESERQREKERESRTRQWGSEMNVVEEKERRDMESEKQNTGGK